MLEEQLSDAIFGGPPPNNEELAAFLERQGIKFPTRITAIAENGPSRPSRNGSVELRLHPGLRYRFAPAKRIAQDLTLAADVGSVVRALQQAVLVERRRELREIVTRDTGSASLQAELQSLHIAIQHLRESRNQQLPEAVEVWIQIIVSRHQDKMHTVRRKFIEFYAQLTRGVDADISYLFHNAIQRTMGAYQFRQLVAEFRKSVLELHAILAGRQIVGPSEPTSHSLPVQRAFRFIEQNFAEPIGLKEVAKTAYVSASHLARQFRKETNRTVVDYLQLLRVNRARELLSSTAESILEVSLDSGFPSVEHFHRIFRRETGMTPRKYRLRNS